MESRRVAVAVPLIAILSIASWNALAIAESSTWVYEANSSMMQWRQPMAKSPSANEVSAVEAKLKAAMAMAPGNPAARDLLGSIAMNEGRDAAAAAAFFKESLKLRPSSSFTWASLAAAGYASGSGGPETEGRLRNAAMLGPYEPEVQRIVVDYGLAVWPALSTEGRRAVSDSLARGMLRKPSEMLQIAKRRGRLGLACGHASRNAQLIDSKKIQTCQGMEATP